MAAVILLGLVAMGAWVRAYPAASTLDVADWWLRSGNVARAEAAYTRLLSLLGNTPNALELVGDRLSSAGEWRKAERYYRRAVAADRRHPALAKLGVVYEKTGRDGEAENAYHEAVRRRPGDPRALNGLGYFYAQRGYRLGLAVDLLRRAVELAPDDPAITDSLGWALYQRGDLRAAIEQLERAVRAMPAEAELRYHLGVAFARAGTRDRALVELGKAVMQDPGLAEAREALRQARAGKLPSVPLVPPGLRRPPEPGEGQPAPARPAPLDLPEPRLPRGRVT